MVENKSTYSLEVRDISAFYVCDDFILFVHFNSFCIRYELRKEVVLLMSCHFAIFGNDEGFYRLK